MKSRLAIISGNVLLLLAMLLRELRRARKEALRLAQTISMPNVKGRIDHMDVDVKGKQLVVAGLENGSLEVVDLKGGKSIKSVPGFQKPQGIAYVESLNKVFVASGDDGMLRCQTLGERSLSHPTVCSSGPSPGFRFFPATRWQ